MLKVVALGLERDNQELFSNITFYIQPGTLVFVSGPNGSGKSSLLKILAGICSATAGERYCSEEIYYLGHKLGLQLALSPEENLKIWMELSSPLTYTNNENNQYVEKQSAKSIQDKQSSQFSQNSQSEAIRRALMALKLWHLAEIPCENLSRGECQRVALAGLWLNPPICWILDEPFTGLDKQGVEIVCRRFSEHLQKGGIIFMATHQLFAVDSPHTVELVLGTAV